MPLIDTLIAAVLLALAGAGHCLGMCGGISLSLSMAVPQAQRSGLQLWRWQLAFASGRLATYSLLGALAGGLGQALVATFPAAGRFGWLLAALLMLMLALMLIGHDLGLARLERLGLGLWRRLQPHMQGLLPLRHFHQALLLGLFWGFLPCGLLYTALAFAVASHDAGSGALVMLVFGLVTVVPVAVGGVATGMLTLLRRAGWRRLTALLTLLMAGWLFWQALSPHGHATGVVNPAAISEQHHQ